MPLISVSSASDPVNNIVDPNQSQVQPGQTVQAEPELVLNPQASAEPVSQEVSKAQPVGAADENIENLGEVAELSNTIDKYLTEAESLGASDVHFTVGFRVFVRVDGVLRAIGSPVLTSEATKMYAQELLQSRDLDINSINESDLTHSVKDRRFRVNIFKQMGDFSIVCRIIPQKILTIDELGLPQILKEFSKFPNGLVILTGPTGSGKSTSIASILNLINLTTPDHIVTLEDPVEFVFPKGVGLIDQREYGIDFKSWANALRAVLRQDPDVVLVGEMRDLETVESALQIAETGHLVFATLHTNSAAQTIDRIVDIFPAEKQSQIRIQLAGVLRAVVSQRLLKMVNGGRKPAVEILISTPAVRNSILEMRTNQIDNIIQTSMDMGMISLERSLVTLVKQGLVSADVAKSVSNKPDEIDMLLNQR